MSLKNLFFSPVDSRLRSGWRILFFFLLNFSITLLILLPIFSILRFNPEELSPRNLLIGGLVSAVSLGIAIYASRRGIDRKTVESLGIQPEGMWRDISAGIGIAGVMMLFIFLVVLAGGWIDIEGFAWEFSAFSVWGVNSINMILLFLIVGITEELQFRGYVLQNLEEGLNMVPAVLLSAAIFAVMHSANPGALTGMPLLGLFFAGIFFAYAYLRTRTLWLAIGLHIGWNFFESTVFGFAVSGVNTGGWLLQTVTGPDWITGGAFGPEAGLVLVPAILLGVLLVYLYTKE